MTRQRNLFDDAPSGETPTTSPNTPITSAAAAVAAKPMIGRQRKKILQFLISLADHGATDVEIQDELSINGNSERPRRRELERLGLVADSGRVRLTPSGRSAVVWTATAKAMQVLEITTK